ncbi:MAG: sodium-translocating pyrophosphatase, partial [Methylomonas sp.]
IDGAPMPEANFVTLISVVLGISFLGLGFSAWMANRVLAKDTGNDEMRAISNAIKEGAEAFMRRQNLTILSLAGVFAVLLFIGYGVIRPHQAFDPVAGTMQMAFWITASFIFGAICSVLAGYMGMWISIRSNIRVAAAARASLNEAVRIALRAGGVSGMLVVAMSLCGVAGLFALVKLFTPEIDIANIPLLIVGYGFGASFVALFAQVGGGIYTKAADVGADLVGKIEAGIPEDDPRNPAVIADLVGDNVGDCAGRGADLFESTAAENIGAMILGGGLALAAEKAGMAFNSGAIGLILFPLVARGFGIVACIIGILSVRLQNEDQQPMQALNRGFFISVAVIVPLFGLACKWLLENSVAGDAWWLFFLCGIVGVMTSIAIVYITQYYTEDRFRPVKAIAAASTTGPATNIIEGTAVGLESTWPPTLAIGSALLVSYYLGVSSGIPHAGIFGTAVATMGMLTTAGYILAMDTFGPIADNAGGIMEMSLQSEAHRRRTDKLDAVGNTTKALTKGYAVGSAGLAAFLLFQAYIDEVKSYAGFNEAVEFTVNIDKPIVFVGAFLGTMLVFLFCSMTIRAVGAAAKSIIEEVRRQYAHLPRIDDIIQFPDHFKPDYKACVDIVTLAALRNMAAPGLLVVLSPIAVGLVFKSFAGLEGKLIAAESVAAMLMAATICGILMALYLNNAGGAWDNAKKYVESGAHGGKFIIDTEGRKIKNPVHAATVVGDTVGDPFKDTAGPSLHVLIKLLATVTLVTAPLFI